MTRQLPTITNTFINAKNASEIKFSNSVHCTESISVQLLIARPETTLECWIDFRRLYGKIENERKMP